jgi:hypothetical protein
MRMAGAYRYKKQCVWCWKKRDGLYFRRISPLKRLEVCVTCEERDPEGAAKISAWEARMLKQTMRRELERREIGDHD